MFYVLGIFRCKVQISVEIFGPTLIEWSVVSWEKGTPHMVKSPCLSHCNLSQLYLWICFELQGCLGLQTRTNHPFLVPKIAAAQLKLSTELPWNRGCRRRFCPHRSPRKVERRGVARQTSWSKHNLFYLFLGGKMSKQHSIWSKMSIELKTTMFLMLKILFWGDSLAYWKWGPNMKFGSARVICVLFFHRPYFKCLVGFLFGESATVFGRDWRANPSMAIWWPVEMVIFSVSIRIY